MRTLVFGVAVMLSAAFAAEVAMIQPRELASELTAKGPQATVFQVGPNVLYRGKHIPGSLYAGPAGRPEGLELLKQAVSRLPRDGEIIIYCGCCPWGNCPNMKPAHGSAERHGLHARQSHISGEQLRQRLD